MDIPLIDLAGREAETAAQIARACGDSGFFGVAFIHTVSAQA